MKKLGAKDPEELYESKAPFGAQRYEVFDLDIARTLLLMSSIMYERNDALVKQAALYPSWTQTLLLKAEEVTRDVADSWGMSFAGVSDFLTVAGPYCGIFYDKKLEQNWIVVAFKGTSPTNFSEWLVDATFAHEVAEDYLWGNAHKGFYDSLFPGSGSAVDPSGRIIEAIKAVAQELKTDKPIQLWVTGHSLGAGLASLFYSRILKEPGEGGSNIKLRDSYLYGCPRTADTVFATEFEGAMNIQSNQTKTFYRVQNSWDVVALVPPGTGDKRDNRSSISPQSLLNYAALGSFMHLTPGNGNGEDGSFYYFDKVGLKAARTVLVTEDTPADQPFPTTTYKWTDPIVIEGFLLKLLFPILNDHFPTEYWSSLLKCEGKPLPPDFKE